MSPDRREDERPFFVHVMKTGGATFRRRMEANLGAEFVYPNTAIDSDMRAANADLSYFRTIPEERMRSLRGFTGHFPFIVTKLVPGPVVTMTVLRDPVERTISYLKHCRVHQEQHHGMALEEIYEDPWYYPLMMENHQVRVFALRLEDDPENATEIVTLDEERLGWAREHLESVDFIGLHSHYDDFVEEVTEYFGWSGKAPPNWHVSEPEHIPESFRRRIAEDMAIDMAFYEFAKELHSRRHPAKATG
jgi:hypothetical protein